MALETEVLLSRNAIILYSAQTTWGTPVTPATAVGIVSYDVTSDTDLRDIYSIGAAGVKFFKPGINSVDWNINITNLQTKAFLLKAVRASGALPLITLGFGYKDDAGTAYLWQVQDCKIGAFDLDVTAGNTIPVSTSGPGRLITNLSAGTAAHLTAAPFFSYEAVFTKAAAAYESRRVRIAVDHHIQKINVVHGAAPSTLKRFPKYFPEGKEEVSGEIERFQKSAANLQADTLTDFAMSLVLTDIAGGCAPNAMTLATADTQWGSERQTASDDPDEPMTWTTPFKAKTFSLT